MNSPPSLIAFLTVLLTSLKQSLNDSPMLQLFGTLQVFATFFVKHVTTLATVFTAFLNQFFLLLLPPSRWLRSCLCLSCSSTSPSSSFSSSWLASWTSAPSSALDALIAELMDFLIEGLLNLLNFLLLLPPLPPPPP